MSFYIDDLRTYLPTQGWSIIDPHEIPKGMPKLVLQDAGMGFDEALPYGGDRVDVIMLIGSFREERGDVEKKMIDNRRTLVGHLRQQGGGLFPGVISPAFSYTPRGQDPKKHEYIACRVTMTASSARPAR